ncbi:hypothetical protein [Marinomonas atlantica]|uniref:hypothetical protein n=1 Tax=Marinomonas atlantica TaxID=1806668 RepID=UPI0008363E3F|nr:hypothetical protein [Marinomonas atlantica]
MTTPRPPIVKWNAPDTVPEVELGTEKQFWIAVETKHGITVFEALYQNRPSVEGEDWTLIGEDGEYISSVGWVQNQAHYEFADFYVPLGLCENCKLLGWAEYEAPEFTGVTANVA